MLLACPNCQTRFVFPPSALPLEAKGIRVRCGECREVWLATPPSEDADHPQTPRETSTEVAKPETRGEDDSPPSRATNIPSARSSRGKFFLRCIAVLGIVTALLVGGWYGKQTLLARYPFLAPLHDALAPLYDDSHALISKTLDSIQDALAPVYRALDLASNQNVLHVRDVTSVWDTVEGESVLDVAGVVVNFSDAVQTVPALEVDLRNESGATMLVRSFEASESRVGADDVVTFSIRIREPPSGSKYVRVFFAQPADPDSQATYPARRQAQKTWRGQSPPKE